VFQADLYGGTFLFVEELKRLGIRISMARTVEEFAGSICEETRVLYAESPSNPLLRVLDLAAIGGLGRERQVLTVVDNTFGTPINQNPIALGIDVVIHSGTKYLNGHSDLNAGLVVASAETIKRIATTAVNHGGVLDAYACYLLERGMKTLALRMRAHNENANRLAEFLVTHPAVAAVFYPGLRNDPGHAVAARQMRGFGGMLSFELREPSRVDRVLAAFQLVMPALSLGGVESLVCIPSRTSHRKLSPAERQAAGIGDGLIRLSVGIEALEDLLEDFDSALRA
jgi:cystathionine beta-lyase